MTEFGVSSVCVNKANKFISKAKELGWTARYRILAEDTIQVTVTRPNEKIVIEWAEAKLAVSPLYWLHEMRRVLGNAAACIKIMERPKPDMDPYYRWQRTQARKGSIEVDADGGQEIDVSQYTLPFDPLESPDSEILRAIRGNTLIFRNTMTGFIESVFVPYKTSDGKTFNWNTKDVFYLAESSEGRAFLTFMDSQGRFRSVHLDRMIGVV